MMVLKTGQDLQTLLEQTTEGQVKLMNQVERKTGCQAERETEYQTKQKMINRVGQKMGSQVKQRVPEKI